MPMRTLSGRFTPFYSADGSVLCQFSPAAARAANQGGAGALWQDRPWQVRLAAEGVEPDAIACPRRGPASVGASRRLGAPSGTGGPNATWADVSDPLAQGASGRAAGE